MNSFPYLVRRLAPVFALLAIVCAATAGDFIISYWCGPPPSEDPDKRFAEVAECNFTYAMPPCAGVTLAQNKAALDACQKHGLKYVVMDSRIMALAPNNPGFNTNLDAVIADYSKHPAFGGYFLADEPGPGAFPQLGAVNQYLLEKDPRHLPFINLYPNYVPEWAIGGPYEKHVADYLDTVKPRLLSFDHYALMGDGTERPNYFENLEIIRRQALKHNVPFASIFLVTPHGGYRDPNENDLRWQVNTALAYGARGLLYFTYWTPHDDTAGFHNGIIDEKGTRTAHYPMARRINADVKRWAPTLLQLTSTGVYHTAPVPSGAVALPKDAPVQIDTKEGFVIGTFKHRDGSDWVMIVNRDVRKDVTATLQLDSKVKSVKELWADTGKLRSLQLSRHEMPIALLPGSARLLKLVR